MEQFMLLAIKFACSVLLRKVDGDDDDESAGSSSSMSLLLFYFSHMKCGTVGYVREQ
jgi:hypothetical protein